MEFKNLTATVVNVSLLDKLLKTNTGTIVFGSPSSPLVQVGNNGQVSPFRFTHVEKPYEVLKEIKTVINK